MVDRAEHYYCALFKVYQGVTKGDPLTPKIFNIVVDAVIQHWVILATGEEAGYEGFGRSFKMLPTLLYTYIGILAYPCPAWLQESLKYPTGLFEQIGL